MIAPSPYEGPVRRRIAGKDVAAGQGIRGCAVEESATQGYGVAPYLHTSSGVPYSRPQCATPDNRYVRQPTYQGS